MKKIINTLFAASAVFALTVSCEKEIKDPVSDEVIVNPGDELVNDNTIVFKASFENPATKTELAAGNKVQWLDGDAISFFDGETNVSAETATGGENGSFTVNVTSAAPWYALYPYNSSASISGGIITTTLPSTQTAVAGSFADDLNIAVATTSTTSLSFKNVLGLIKFKVGADADIVKVTLTGNNSEVLAGTVDIDYNSGDPTWSIKSGAATSIELTGTFVKGQTYYFAVLPQTFTNGFTLTYTNSSDVDRVESTSNELVLGRSKIRNIGSPDIITFADPDVKAALVAHFDANSDGEISKAEAEAVTYNDFEAIVGDSGDTVTDLWGADLTVIDTFDELKYFTGLTNSNQSNRYQLPVLFRGCTNLTSVKIPDNITHLSNYTFADCSSLDGVVLPSGLTHIFAQSFKGCASLTSLTMPSTVQAISSAAFQDCTSLVSVDGFGDTSLTIINANTFNNCSSLATIAIPATVTSLGTSCFERCSALTSFTGGTGITEIGKMAFKNCSEMGKLPFNSAVQNLITTIGADAFENCTKMTLSSRNIRGAATIGKGAFKNCKGITNLTVNNAAYQVIQDSTFFGCSSLATIRVSDNLTQVLEHAFNGCVKLTTFSNTGTGNGFVLPPEVTRIRAYAFSDCRVLASANATPGVPDFSNNTALTRIDDRAFRYCAAFVTVELPSTVTYIRRAFESNTGSRQMTMTSLKLPNTDGVVSGGTATYLVFGGTWDTEAHPYPTVYVPADLVEAYKADAHWSNYASQIVGF